MRLALSDSLSSLKGRLFSTCLLIVLILRPLMPAGVLACAVCITGTGDDGLADAFNGSVLFLMAAPYLVVGSIAGWLFYTYRRATAKREKVEAEQPPVHLAWNQKETGR